MFQTLIVNPTGEEIFKGVRHRGKGVNQMAKKGRKSSYKKHSAKKHNPAGSGRKHTAKSRGGFHGFHKKRSSKRNPMGAAMSGEPGRGILSPVVNALVPAGVATAGFLGNRAVVAMIPALNNTDSKLKIYGAKAAATVAGGVGLGMWNKKVGMWWAIGGLLEMMFTFLEDNDKVDTMFQLSTIQTQFDQTASAAPVTGLGATRKVTARRMRVVRDITPDNRRLTDITPDNRRLTDAIPFIPALRRQASMG